MEKAERPRVVGFLQTVLLVICIVNAFSLVLRISQILGKEQSLVSILVLIEALVLLILFVTAASRMASRKNSGRWLAVISYGLLAARGVWGIVWYASIPADPNHPFRMVITVALIATLPPLYVAAALVLAFSPKVNAYFVPQPEIVESLPPPPPTFDD